MSDQPNESLAAKVLKFGDLISYQGGSVVSRVILKQKGGNGTVFAFDTGQELSEHTAPFDALVNILEGEVEVTISGGARRRRDPHRERQDHHLRLRAAVQPRPDQPPGRRRRVPLPADQRRHRPDHRARDARPRKRPDQQRPNHGRIDSNVGQSGSVFGWDKGDFNYDGKINIDDYGIIDGNINRQGAVFPTAGGATSVALEGVAAVPEPVAGLLLGIAGVYHPLRRLRRPPASSRR